MPSLTDDLGFVDVDRVETTDIALGGNETNVPNKNFRQLASRDKWLYDQLTAFIGLGDSIGEASYQQFKNIGMAAIAQGRLTPQSGQPVPTTNQLAATTIYYTPYNGDWITLWNSVDERWDAHQFTERSLSLTGLTANTNYDIFAYYSAPNVLLEAVAWSNSGAGVSTRAQPVSRKNGVWVKTSDNRKLLGTFRTTSVVGQTEISFDNPSAPSKILIQNAFNRVVAKVKRYDPTTSWTYASTTKRPWNNSVNNRIEIISCIGDELMALVFGANVQSDPGLGYAQNGIAINATNADNSDYSTNFTGVNNDAGGVTAGLNHTPIAGYNFYQMIEFCFAVSTQTFYGNIGASFIPSSLIGVWRW